MPAADRVCPSCALIGLTNKNSLIVKHICHTYCKINHVLIVTCKLGITVCVNNELFSHFSFLISESLL